MIVESVYYPSFKAFVSHLRYLRFNGRLDRLEFVIDEGEVYRGNALLNGIENDCLYNSDCLRYSYPEDDFRIDIIRPE